MREKWPREARDEFNRLVAGNLSPAESARQIFLDKLVDSPVPEATYRNWPKIAERERAKAGRIAAAKVGYDQNPTLTVSHRDSVVLAIPDLHCPFEHSDALAFLKAVKQKYQPTTIVCLGDEIDAHAFSRFPKDPDGLTGGQEMTKAREHLLPFYLEFPNVLVCESNHTVRPWKIAFEHGLPASFLPSYAAFLNAPDGWKWQSRHYIDNVLYIHGDAGRSGQYAAAQYVKAFKQSVVHGHIHSYAGVSYEGKLFGVNSGCLIDPTAYCFKYAKNMAISVNLGCCIIKNGIQAEFIPMHLDENDRWTGKL